MSAWTSVSEGGARAAAAEAIRQARRRGEGLARAVEYLREAALSELLRDRVDEARLYARAAVLVQARRDRQVDRWLREHEAARS